MAGTNQQFGPGASMGSANQRKAPRRVEAIDLLSSSDEDSNSDDNMDVEVDDVGNGIGNGIGNGNGNRIGNGNGNGNGNRIGNGKGNGNPMPASRQHRAKQVMDSFLRERAASGASSTQRSREVYRSIMDSDNESSDSNDEDFRNQLLWNGGFSAKTSIELLEDSHGEDTSTSDGDGDVDGDGSDVSDGDYDDNEDDNDDNDEDHDDSSIEVLGVVSGNNANNSPRRPAMNARHLSNRQRRMEAVRNRNKRFDRDTAFGETEHEDSDTRGEEDESEYDRHRDDEEEDPQDYGDATLLGGDKDANEHLHKHEQQPQHQSQPQQPQPQPQRQHRHEESEPLHRKPSATERDPAEACSEPRISGTSPLPAAMSSAQSGGRDSPGAPEVSPDTDDSRTDVPPIIGDEDVSVPRNEAIPPKPPAPLPPPPKTNGMSEAAKGPLSVPESTPNTTVQSSKAKKTARKTSWAKARAAAKTGRSSSCSSTSAAFDNLYMNGKDFIVVWAGITDPREFLVKAKTLEPKVNAWRHDRNSAPLSDPSNYIKTLRRQVRDNIKVLAKKQGQRKSTSSTAKAVARSPKRQRLLGERGASALVANPGKTLVYPSLDELPASGGSFIEYMGLKTAEEVLLFRGLAKHVNDWRKSQGVPPVQNVQWAVYNWRRWIKDNTLVKHPGGKVTKATREDIGLVTGDGLRGGGRGGKGVKKNRSSSLVAGVAEDQEGIDIDSSNCMVLVPPLSKRFLNEKTGLPVYQFAVYDTRSKDTIYEFRVEANPSWIPNAGNGAFLTFLGAREARSPGIADLDAASQPEVRQPLVSKDSDGYHMNVRVVGEQLETEDQTFRYPPTTTVPSVHGSAEKLVVDGSSRYPWKLGPEGKRLVAEYAEIPDRLFSTSGEGCSTIELGRYGPFRRSDRKTQLHYDMKNFVFSNETSEWGFDILEDLNGEEQVADVTDDVTGMPHHVAKQNICMYVNETGGDPDLQQTVWSQQVMDREVNYFIQTDKPMKKGETIELLISYFGTYNEIRERKGYGQKNKSGEVRSDDHLPTFLERNFIERYDMVEVLYEVRDAMTLYRLSEFLDGIRGKLAEIVETFVVGDIESTPEGVYVPFAQQIVALRRLNWIKPFFLKKIENVRRKVEKSGKEDPLAVWHMSILNRCTENAKALDWGLWPRLMDRLDEHPNLIDKRGINLRAKFREEVTEEICYGVNTTLFCPCNEAVWCGVASTLTHDLCYLIARHRWDYKEAKPLGNLSAAFLQIVAKASEEIRNPKSLDDLKFDSTIWMRYALNNRGNLPKEPAGTECVLTLANDCHGPELRLPAPIVLRKDSSSEKSQRKDSFSDQSQLLKTIHKPWYLTRQIVFLADTFAKKYLIDEKSYSFAALCEKVDITVQTTSLFMIGDIELDHKSRLFFGREFRTIYSTGNSPDDRIIESLSKPAARSVSSKPEKSKPCGYRKLTTPVKKLLFWNVLVKGLLEMKWSIERGTRPNDWYLMPPGIRRGAGFKPRVDFFDSALLVLTCLTSDDRYCNSPAIKSLMSEYRGCQKEYEKMRDLKASELKTLSNEEIVDLLKRKVRNRASRSADKSADKPAGTSETTHCLVQNGGDATTKLRVAFHADKLGLMLKKVEEGELKRICVVGVDNPMYKTRVRSGDFIVAIEDHEVRNETLSDVCARLKDAKRPVTITFERKGQAAEP